MRRGVDEEIRELNEAKKEIYLEAKSNGFDVKVLREVVRLRKQDQKERECENAPNNDPGVNEDLLFEFLVFSHPSQGSRPAPIVTPSSSRFASGNH